MANLTSNTTAFIRAQLYSRMIQEGLNDQLVSQRLSWDVSEFTDGTTFYIPSIGDVIVRDYTEDSPIVFDAIDTGQISMTIDQFKSTATYVSNKLLEDGYLGQELVAKIPSKHLRALLEEYETRMFAKLNAAQTATSANTVNGQSHRLVASGTSQVVTLTDFAKIKTSFDLANVPDESRVMFIDPRGEHELNKLTNLVNVANNPKFEGIVTGGFAKRMRFVVNIYGIDIYCNNRLPDIASETIGGSTVTSGKAAIAMCVADPDVMPLMSAWRRRPVCKGEENIKFDRHEYSTTARYGFGVKRSESLVVLLHNISNV